jgi:carbon-monoxide dehydrogenase large subunit
MAGVATVFTPEDAAKTPSLPLTITLPGMKRTSCYCLAVGKVYFVGEPVAAVVATDRYQADDALERIVVEYEPLPAVVDAEAALRSDAPLLYEEWGDNVRVRYHFHGGDVAGAFARADTIVRETIRRHRYTSGPIETRAYLASYESATGHLTMWASTQTPHILRSLLAESIAMPEHRVRVITPAVGGGFGCKIPLYQEEPLLAHLAMRIGRPVKWVETRREHLMSAAHSREQVHYMEVAVKWDGTVLGIRDKMIADLGAYVPQSGLQSVLATSSFVPSGYRVENYEVDMYAVHTNKAPFGAVRGFGKADANFVIERMLDIVARELRLDPLEVRLRNFIQPHEFPYTTVTGALLDSGNYPACLQRAMEAVDYENFRREQPELWRRGTYRGASVVFMFEPSANAVADSLHTGYESAVVRIDPSGHVTILAGVAGQGQGHETALAQIAADELGVTPDDITVIAGDTGICPYGLGAWASRFAITGAGSVILACRQLRTKMSRIAAVLLGATADELEGGTSRFFVKGQPERATTVTEIARTAYTQLYKLPAGLEPGLEALAHYITPNIRYVPDEKHRLNMYPSYTSGAYGVIVEVDPASGRVQILRQVFVDDCGNIINPLLVEGQALGGVAQGIGGAMFEELLYGADGQFLSSTFTDYLLPSAMEVPDAQVLHVVTPSPVTLGGFKGAGEGGCIPPPPALTNAVEDALRPFGVRMLAQPLSPQNVWRAVQAARRHATSR